MAWFSIDSSTIWRWLAMAAVCYGVIIVVVMYFENDLVYPAPTSPGLEKPASFEVHTLTTSDGEKLQAYYCPATEEQRQQSPLPDAGEGPWVLMICHGNGSKIAFMAPLIEELQRRLGVDVFVYDYRGYGESTGSPSEQGLYRDTHAAYQFLMDEKRVSPDRLLVMGRSLGGAVAIELAMHKPFRALLLVNTFSSMVATGQYHHPWLPVYWMMRNRYPSIDRLPQVKRPVHIAYGDADDVVPPAHSKQLFDLAPEPKALFVTPGAGHNTILKEEYYQHLIAFLKQALVPASTPASG